MEIPLGFISEKRIQKWISEPWLLLKQTFMILSAATLLGGIVGITLSGTMPSTPRISGDLRDISLKPPPQWEYYSSVILKGSLFQATAPAVIHPRPIAVKTIAPVVHKVTLAELAADLTLVGIVNNGGLQAAIMSNRTKEVSYLSVGQQIGEITVAAIEGNHVQLSYQGETMALSL